MVACHFCVGLLAWLSLFALVFCMYVCYCCYFSFTTAVDGVCDGVNVTWPSWAVGLVVW